MKKVLLVILIVSFFVGCGFLHRLPRAGEYWYQPTVVTPIPAAKKEVSKEITGVADEDDGCGH